MGYLMGYPLEELNGHLHGGIMKLNGGFSSKSWLPEGKHDDVQWENWGALLLYHVNLEDDRKQ